MDSLVLEKARGVIVGCGADCHPEKDREGRTNDPLIVGLLGGWCELDRVEKFGSRAEVGSSLVHWHSTQLTAIGIGVQRVTATRA